MENILVANVEYSPIGLRPGIDGGVTSSTGMEKMPFISSIDICHPLAGRQRTVQPPRDCFHFPAGQPGWPIPL